MMQTIMSGRNINYKKNVLQKKIVSTILSGNHAHSQEIFDLIIGAPRKLECLPDEPLCVFRIFSQTKQTLDILRSWARLHTENYFCIMPGWHGCAWGEDGDVYEYKILIYNFFMKWFYLSFSGLCQTAQLYWFKFLPHKLLQFRWVAKFVFKYKG